MPKAKAGLKRGGKAPPSGTLLLVAWGIGACFPQRTAESQGAMQA